MIAEELKEQNLINKTDSEFYQIIDLIWNKLSELEEKQIIEILAEYAHNAWSGWMKYLFNLSKHNLDESVTIPKELVDRWKRQLSTSYEELPEHEKESDQVEAKKIITICC